MSGLKHKAGRRLWREGWCFVQLQFFFSSLTERDVRTPDRSCIGENGFWCIVGKFETSGLVGLGFYGLWSGKVFLEAFCAVSRMWLENDRFLCLWLLQDIIRRSTGRCSGLWFGIRCRLWALISSNMLALVLCSFGWSRHFSNHGVAEFCIWRGRSLARDFYLLCNVRCHRRKARLTRLN